MYKFCTIADVEEDEQTKIRIPPRSKQHNIGKHKNISNDLLQNPSIYENVALNVAGHGSNEFKVIPKDTVKHSDAIYEDIRYKLAMVPRIQSKPPLKPKPRLKKVTAPQVDITASFTPSHTDSVLKDDVAKKKNETSTTCDNLKRNKPQLQPKPKLNTLKQHKISLQSKKAMNVSLETTTTTTTPADVYVLMTSIDDENKESARSTSVLEPEGKSKLINSPREDYLTMMSSDKGSYEVNAPNDVISTSETDKYCSNDHEYCDVKDVTEFETPQANYSQIDEAKIEKCIYSFDDSEDLEIESQVSKDELSEMLYLPVDQSLSCDLSMSLETGCGSEKYYDFDVVEKIVRGTQHSPVVAKTQVKKSFIKPVIEEQFHTSIKTESKNTSVFVDFSDDSLLAKLGEKMRKDLENKKFS